MNPEVSQLYPAAFSDAFISKRLAPTFGRIMFNYTKVARELSKSEQPLSECKCRTLFRREFRPGGGCVRTGNMKLVALKQLRKTFEYGARLRTRNPQYDPLQAIERAPDSHILQDMERDTRK